MANSPAGKSILSGPREHLPGSLMTNSTRRGNVVDAVVVSPPGLSREHVFISGELLPFLLPISPPLVTASISIVDRAMTRILRRDAARQMRRFNFLIASLRKTPRPALERFDRAVPSSSAALRSLLFFYVCYCIILFSFLQYIPKGL